MEKFSAYRDPGTGIQPFLTPVPPVSSDVLANALLPLGYVVGIVRTVLIVALGVIYAVLVGGVCKLLSPIRPLYRPVTHALTAIISRLVLLLVGIWWIPVVVVARKRGQRGKAGEASKWSPKAGDVIVSNWVSWIEVLWLAFRFNPTFIVPVCQQVELAAASRSSSPITSTPGRRTGTGSAAISSPAARAVIPRSDVLGFREVSLLKLISLTGTVPATPQDGVEYCSFEELRSKADGPVVVFPECTTSNGRGLLMFSNIFPRITLPVKVFQVFVMCVRYDPPTPLSPTLSHSIASPWLNPLSHIFKLASTLVPLSLSIRLLEASGSPSSGAFLASEFCTPGSKNDDVLAEACAALIAEIGKMKRVGMGWEDKAAFLTFYRGKRK